MEIKIKCDRGFTLLELLVVIAIVAILAALLLPTLSRAKNQGAKAADFNNLRQIMIALHVYTGENHDVITWPNWDYGGAMPDGTAQAGWLYTPVLGAKGTNAFPAPSGLLWDSLRAPAVYLCPMDQPAAATFNAKGKAHYRANQLCSYIMNGAVIGFRSGYYGAVQPVTMSQMQPGDCILFEGDGSDPFHFNDGSSWPSEGVTTRHLQGATYAAVDGSAHYVRDADWLASVYDTNKNYLWCYPKTADGGDPKYGHVIMR